MNKTFTILYLFLLLSLSQTNHAQEYVFEDFVGTWHGYISSESFGGYYDLMTMHIEPDGFYTETSGHLMPTIYPNTQQCEFEAETNRFHWWYLKTVYAGQYFYQHFFYELVYFNNDTLEMHYNFWDDPEPYPHVGTIFLVREIATSIDDEPVYLSEDLYQLGQNFPNPVRESTSFVVELSSTLDATINLYSITGNKIETIFSGELSSGVHNIDYRLPSELSGGIYFYTLETGQSRITRKMHVVR
jgi:hypothetical protein